MDNNSYERDVALRESSRIHINNEYFKARPQVDNDDRRNVFDAGYDRGWQAAKQQSAGEIANLMLNIEAQEKLGYELQADNERSQAQVNELKSLLNEARDDVAAQLDNYQQLLPYKQHRYDAQKITLDSIDEALAKTTAQCLIEHDNEVLSKIHPRNWTKSMNTAWHKAIPDVHKAFDFLIKELKG